MITFHADGQPDFIWTGGGKPCLGLVIDYRVCITHNVVFSFLGKVVECSDNEAWVEQKGSGEYYYDEPYCKSCLTKKQFYLYKTASIFHQIIDALCDI